MTSTEIRSELQRFVNDALGDDISGDADVFEAGATSLLAVELVMFIEKTFGVELDDGDLELENFSTVAAMADLAQRKLAAK